MVGGIGISIAQAQQAQASHAQAAAGYTSPATYTPPPAPTEVAFLGDSFTIGTGAEKKFDRWTTLLAQEKEWVELNYGFGGTNFSTAGTLKGGRPYHERLTDLILSQPDIVIVSSAGNTLSVNQEPGIEVTFQKIREGLPDARIIALSPLSRAGEYRGELVSFGTDIKAAVEEVGGEYVDVGHPLEDHPQAMDADGVHPNSIGHQIIADAAADTLRG